jgi:hypothetical protein
VSEFYSHVVRAIAPAYLDCPESPAEVPNAVSVDCNAGMGPIAPVPVSPGYYCNVTCETGYARFVDYVCLSLQWSKAACLRQSFQVDSGDCVADRFCLYSPGYYADEETKRKSGMAYPADTRCAATVTEVTDIVTPEFDIGDDRLIINGTTYTGDDGPGEGVYGETYGTGARVFFRTDGAGSGSSFRICKRVICVRPPILPEGASTNCTVPAPPGTICPLICPPGYYRSEDFLCDVGEFNRPHCVRQAFVVKEGQCTTDWLCVYSPYWPGTTQVEPSLSFHVSTFSIIMYVASCASCVFQL